MITRALGHKDTIAVDTQTRTIETGDMVILCSDGLTDYVNEYDIISTITTQPAQQACTTLVNMANSRGGGDNITVVCAQTASPAHVIQTPRVKSRPKRKTLLIPLVLSLVLIAVGLIHHFGNTVKSVMRRGSGNPPERYSDQLKVVEPVRIEPADTRDQEIVKQTTDIALYIDKAFDPNRSPGALNAARKAFIDLVNGADRTSCNKALDNLLEAVSPKESLNIEELSLLLSISDMYRKNGLGGSSFDQLERSIQAHRQAFQEIEEPGSREIFTLANEGTVSISQRGTINEDDYERANWWKILLPREGSVEFIVEQDHHGKVALDVFSVKGGKLDLAEKQGDEGMVLHTIVSEPQGLFVKVSPGIETPLPLDYEYSMTYRAGAQ